MNEKVERCPVYLFSWSVAKEGCNCDRCIAYYMRGPVWHFHSLESFQTAIFVYLGCTRFSQSVMRPRKTLRKMLPNKTPIDNLAMSSIASSKASLDALRGKI